MELNWKNIRKILLIITFAILLYTAVQNIDFFWSMLRKFITVLRPFFIGLCLAFILNVIMRPIERLFVKLTSKRKKGAASLKMSRLFSLCTTILLTLSVFVLLIVVVVPELKVTFQLVKTNVPDYYDKAKNFVIGLLGKYNINTDFISNSQLDWSSILSKLSGYLTSGSKAVITSAADVTASVVSKVSSCFIGFTFCIYILSQKEKLGGFIRRVASSFVSQRVRTRCKNIIDISNTTFTNFVSSKGLDALILGVLCFIGMLILRLPYAGVSAMLLAILSFIPYIGAFLSTVISAFLILMVSPVKAIIFLVFLFILQTVEGYIIYPRLIGKSVGLPGILVLLSVIIGSSISGIVGMLIAVPAGSVIFALFTEFIDNRENKTSDSQSITEKLFSDKKAKETKTD